MGLFSDRNTIYQNENIIELKKTEESFKLSYFSTLNNHFNLSRLNNKCYVL